MRIISWTEICKRSVISPFLPFLFLVFFLLINDYIADDWEQQRPRSEWQDHLYDCSSRWSQEGTVGRDIEGGGRGYGSWGWNQSIIPLFVDHAEQCGDDHGKRRETGEYSREIGESRCRCKLLTHLIFDLHSQSLFSNFVFIETTENMFG